MRLVDYVFRLYAKSRARSHARSNNYRSRDYDIILNLILIHSGDFSLTQF